MKEVLFSRNKYDWETPDGLFNSLDVEFSFTLDAAASLENTKVKDNYFTVTDDALSQPWYGRVWLNPPYGRDIKYWIQKARYEAYTRAQVVVILVPARTDTAWWHDYIWDTHHHRPQDEVEVRFLKGRLKFKGAPASAPFPSAVIVFRSPVYRRFE